MPSDSMYQAGADGVIKALQTEILALTTERDGLVAVLRKYGRHQPPCALWITTGDAGPNGEQHECTCGLDAALAGKASS